MVVELLQQLLFWQERQKAQDPLKATKKKRLVSGLRSVTHHVYWAMFTGAPFAPCTSPFCSLYLTPWFPMSACQPKATKLEYSRYPADYSRCFLGSFSRRRSRSEQQTFLTLAFPHHRERCAFPHCCFCSSHAPLCLSSLLLLPFTGSSVPFLTFPHFDLPSQGGGKGSEAAQGQDSGGGSQH